MTDTHTESFAEWQKAGAGCTSRAFKHPGRDVTRTWRLAVNFDWLHLWFRAGHRWWRSPSVRRSSMFPEGNCGATAICHDTLKSHKTLFIVWISLKNDKIESLDFVSY